MSTIYQIKQNLETTIAGKEAYLAHINQDLVNARDRAQIMALDATSKFLKINIDELKKILADVEVCCEKATADSWRGVDRQGGI